MAVFGLFWALLLGRASAAGGPEGRAEDPAAGHLTLTTSAGQAHAGTPETNSRQARRWILHRHKPSLVFPKIARGDDPNDDETSDDPNDDDDAWDELNCFDDTDVPFVTWLPVALMRADAPEPAPALRAAPPSSPFLTQRRLRC
jgi:hypothetical protein